MLEGCSRGSRGGAREAVELAQQESRALGHNYVGCEHLLLGIVRQPDAGGYVLERLGVTIDDARSAVRRIVGVGSDGVPERPNPFTPRAKRVLERAEGQARSLGTTEVNTGHLLLALIDEPEGVPVRVLAGFKVDHQRIRNEIIRAESNPAYGVLVG